MCAINDDPLGQTRSPAGSNHSSGLKVERFVLQDFKKWGRTYGRTDTSCEK